jgi:polysaccharide deacetylase 2 family uncharacterized protein YibQ
MGKRRSRRSGPFFTAVLLVFAFIIGILLGVFVERFAGPLGLKRQVPPPEYGRAVAKKTPDQERPTPPRPKTLPSTPPSSKIAIVIDDMGSDMRKLRELLELDAPIAVAVLPHLRFSKEVAREAHANGREVLLHLPMEPKDTQNNNPGKGVLTTAMDKEEVVHELTRDMEAVPFLSGVNNHMGSKFMEDEYLMRTVLEVVKMRDVYFLDSKTTDSSVADKVAKELGLRIASRNVFLDNRRDAQYIKGQLKELLAMAGKRGKAIAIGHPYPETIAVLKEVLPGLRNDGVEVVRLSELVD